MNILGIHYGHNATVAVLQDGKITFAISEERFNRLKNSNGFPHLALKYVYENVIKPQDVDFAVMTQQDIAGYYELKRHNFQSVRDFSASNIHFQRSYSLKKHLLSHLHFYQKQSLFMAIQR
jgi:carbamoyltransferase